MDSDADSLSRPRKGRALTPASVRGSGKVELAHNGQALWRGAVPATLRQEGIP